MEAIIQRHNEEIQMLKQQRSPVVPLPHMPIVSVRELPAERSMASDQVEPLYRGNWIQESPIFQGNSDVMSAFQTRDPKEFTLKPQEIMMEGRVTTPLIFNYGGGGSGSLVGQKKEHTLTLVGSRRNKRLREIWGPKWL
uniref:Uncharacterized protein n=1 Tax=Cannabis sativa TaxID=3483 RepID=A0A803QDU0_CANSA